MTLREFTKDCTKNCRMDAGTIEWRPTTNIRKRTLIFGYTQRVLVESGWKKEYVDIKVPDTNKYEQYWEGVHAGEIVAEEWREIGY